MRRFAPTKCVRCARRRRRRIGASVAHMIRTYPQGFAQLLPKEGACVTGLAFVSPVLHDGEPELPSASEKQPPRGCFPAQRNPVSSHPLCPMSSVSDSVNSRCCTKCDGLCRNSISRHFCRDRCLKSWISPLFFSLHWFLTIFRKWGGRKAVPSLAPPLRRIISYAQLRNIRSGFCQNRGLFIPLYYIYNARFENVKRKSEIF